MKKSIIILLVILLAVAASAAVKKKRFDVGGTSDAPVVTETMVESVAPAESAAVETAVPMPVTSEIVAEPAAKSVAEPGKTVANSRSLYTVIVDEQKVLREKLTAAISAMKSGDWDAIWKFLAICLVYGMLHALGPGHGKSIVVGYFIARRGRWRQVLPKKPIKFSLLFVHVIY